MSDVTETLYLRAVEAAFAAGRHRADPAAMSLCAQILDSEPTHARAATLLAEHLLRSGELDEAIAVCRAALEHLQQGDEIDRRGVVDLTRRLAYALRRAERPLEAVRALEERREVDRSLEAAEELARGYLDIGAHGRARELLEPLQESAHEARRPDALLLLGRSLRAEGDEDAAIHVLASALELHPEHPEIEAELEDLGFYAIVNHGKTVLIATGCATPAGIPQPGWARRA